MTQTAPTLPHKLLKVQKLIGAVTKSSTNPHFKSKFADLNAILDAVKGPLNDAGIFITQGPGKDTNGQYVETSLIDAETSQQVSSRVYFSGTEDTMQKIGAAITYGRRFGLKSLLAMEDTDDDGETAAGRGSSPAPKVTEQTQAKSPVASEKPKAASAPTRKTINEKISVTSKVIIDSKRATQAEIVALLEAYKVKTKEELTDDQAKELLTKLEEKLK